ncbi:toll-like receptor 13 [Aphidius gifuensis]|uniref:toll-like receptor 13 n=1 Tax=Aphidius gifuensis TaxID=684658 RepID=UPI001CDC4791|nr:toll-like receptor 13 [Aphidius gifuensis]
MFLKYMVVKNLSMMPANSVTVIFTLTIIACSLINLGLCRMPHNQMTSENTTSLPSIEMINSTISTSEPNDIKTVDLSYVFQRQNDLKNNLTLSTILKLENYQIDLRSQLAISRILELESYHNDLKTQLADEKTRQHNITTEHLNLISELSIENFKLSTKLEQQQKNISKIMKDYMKLNYEYMELYKAYSIDKQKIKTMNEENKSLHADNDDIENNLDKGEKAEKYFYQGTEQEEYRILFDAKTLLENKLSASLLENNELNNKLSQLNNTLKQTLAEYSEMNKKYNESLETLITCENRVLSLNDQQVNLEKNLTILEPKIKDLTNEVHLLQIEKRIASDQSYDLQINQKKQLNEIKNEYQSNLTNKQQEVKMLKEIIFQISQQDLVESANLLKTLISIMKFNEDNVPDDLLKKRRQFFQYKYNKNQAVVVDDLRKRFDDIALTSNSQFYNEYFCNKKISFYNSTICEFLSEDPDSYEIDLSHRNLAVLPKDIFTGFENLKKLNLSNNRLYYLESSTFNNLTNLQVLDLDNNNLTALSSNTFNGLEKLERLYLSYNQINSLQPSIFNNLLNLKTLYIHENHLISLPKDIFTGLENLENLSMSHNRLNYLESNTFNGLSKLRKVWMGVNHLTTLPKDIFNGLEKLEFLNIQSAQINYLDSDIFDNLPKLNELYISGNNLTPYSKNILKNKYNFKNFYM